jgi:hypothetical protein
MHETIGAEMNKKMTAAEFREKKSPLVLGKLVWCVLGNGKETPQATNVEKLRNAANKLLMLCEEQKDVLAYSYVSSSIPYPGLPYSEFSGGMGGANIGGEHYLLVTGPGICELQIRQLIPGNGTGVVERRDLRKKVVAGLERITTDDRGDILIKRKKITLKLPAILKAIAEFAAKFPPEDTVMVSYRHSLGKKRRRSEEEEEAEL